MVISSYDIDVQHKDSFYLWPLQVAEWEQVWQSGILVSIVDDCRVIQDNQSDVFDK